MTTSLNAYFHGYMDKRGYDVPKGKVDARSVVMGPQDPPRKAKPRAGWFRDLMGKRRGTGGYKVPEGKVDARERVMGDSARKPPKTNIRDVMVRTQGWE